MLPVMLDGSSSGFVCPKECGRGGKRERREAGDEGSRGTFAAGDAAAARGQRGLSVLAVGHLLLAGALHRHVKGIFLDTQIGVCCHGEGSIGRVLFELLCTCQLSLRCRSLAFAGSSLNTKGQNPNSCFYPHPGPKSPKISPFCH